jgi:DNA polymerase III alpha subunit
MALWGGELPTPDLPPPSQRELWTQEVEAFGFPLTGTPLDPYRPVLEGLQRLPASQLGVRAGDNVALAGWLLTRKQARTKRDEPMEFLSFDDGSALFEVTVFPDVWRSCVSRLQTGACYVVTGRVEEEYGVKSVTARTVVPLASLRAPEPRRRPRSDPARVGAPARLEPAVAHLGGG